MSRPNKRRSFATPILTAAEFQAQGTSAAAVLSIANLHTGEVAAVLRKTAVQLARSTGEHLGRRYRPSNDNYRRAARRAV